MTAQKRAKRTIEQDTHWETVEKFAEHVVDLKTVLPETLCLESKSLCHCSTLVVSSEQNCCFWLVDFETHQCDQNLAGKIASVNIVAQKDFCMLTFVPLAVGQFAQKIKILAVEIAE